MTLLVTTLALVLPAGDAPAPRPGPIIRPDRHRVACGVRCDPRWRYVRPLKPALMRIAWCESTNNPRAVSPSGQYYGLLQFDLQTWASVGGRGLPHQATRLEQLFRGARLYRARGPAPWPVCGYR